MAVFLCLLVILVSAASFNHARAFSLDSVKETVTEMQQLYRGMQETYQGLQRFIETIRSLTSLAGFGTVVLFIVTLLVSSGLASAGIPRGPASFLTALIIVDIVWFIFKQSMSGMTIPPLGGMARSNLIVITPMVLVALGRRFLPPLFTSLVRRVTDRSWTRDQFYREVEELDSRHQKMRSSILEDMRRGDRENVPLSLESRRSAREYIKRLERIARYKEDTRTGEEPDEDTIHGRQ
jgi:hypothetical protein